MGEAGMSLAFPREEPVIGWQLHPSQHRSRSTRRLCWAPREGHSLPASLLGSSSSPSSGLYAPLPRADLPNSPELLSPKVSGTATWTLPRQGKSACDEQREGSDTTYRATAALLLRAGAPSGQGTQNTLTLVAVTSPCLPHSTPLPQSLCTSWPLWRKAKQPSVGRVAGPELYVSISRKEISCLTARLLALLSPRSLTKLP